MSFNIQHVVKILDIRPETHDTRHLKVERPAHYDFIPGQATEVSVNKAGWEKKKRPFTFVSLPEESHLEFIIKIYPAHHGVTEQIGRLKKGDEIILRDVWGTISYHGPGYFIAGGAGVTPFVSIFRSLEKEGKLAGNYLFYSNKTEADIILKDSFSRMLGDRFVNTLTKEKNDNYAHGRIDEAFLDKHVTNWDKPFYICGPDSMVSSIRMILENRDVRSEALVFEK